MNTNSNSVRVLKSTYNGMFGHRNIPNLIIGGNQDFTIQLSFILTDKDDVLLYGQEDGFSIKVKNQHLIFVLDNFCVFEETYSLKLESNKKYHIAVRYKSEIVSIFINGTLALEKKSNTIEKYIRWELCH